MTDSLPIPHPTAAEASRVFDTPCDSAMSAPERATAITVDGLASERLELGAVWTELATGRWYVRDHFTTESRLYLVVERQDPSSAPPEIDLLRRTLLGEQQKVVALEREMSPSTITNRLSLTLRLMGLPPRPARVPVLLAASAAAAHRGARLPRARVTRWAPSSHLSIISLERFDDHLEAVLTPAECHVARLVMDGHSHREIAAARACSVRTVANQLGSIFRKLNISGRGQLLMRAVSGAA